MAATGDQTNAAKIRDALYYPYIHIREDLDWVKATLLCFPHLMRMVPYDYELNDRPDILPFCRTAGAGERPLITEAALYSDGVVEAQAKLRRRLEGDLAQHGEAFLDRFSRQSAAKSAAGEGSFQIHVNKFLDLPSVWGPPQKNLLAFLRQHGLAWEARGRSGHGSRWIAVHPELGQTVMAIIACAVARERGCDIVTHDMRMHDVLSTTDADEVYRVLIHGRAPQTAPIATELVDELMQVVIVSGFDLSMLTVGDIAAMSRDRVGLYALKQVLAEAVASIPSITDGQTRRRELKHAADRVLTEWDRERRGRGRFLRKVTEALPDKAEDFVAKLAESYAPLLVGGGIASVALGATLGSAVLGALPGLIIGVIFCGVRAYTGNRAEMVKGPRRFLTGLEDRGATFRAPVLATPIM